MCIDFVFVLFNVWCSFVMVFVIQSAGGRVFWNYNIKGGSAEAAVAYPDHVPVVQDHQITVVLEGKTLG